ncbi:hypothetical protein HK097_008017 [Rhizophlyctis rosea]|uniref:MACPF-like domain-containing protein n=1 Tax=Rhizophlyctis rosea TaxID=64517 RepID=A0AAD5SCE8_9FUNG|nr:hypothetical protein HK097_008017 [Rhizophlyctis rosea]
MPAEVQPDHTPPTCEVLVRKVTSDDKVLDEKSGFFDIPPNVKTIAQLREFLASAPTFLNQGDKFLRQVVEHTVDGERSSRVVNYFPQWNETSPWEKLLTKERIIYMREVPDVKVDEPQRRPYDASLPERLEHISISGNHTSPSNDHMEPAFRIPASTEFHSPLLNLNAEDRENIIRGALLGHGRINGPGGRSRPSMHPAVEDPLVCTLGPPVSPASRQQLWEQTQEKYQVMSQAYHAMDIPILAAPFVSVAGEGSIRIVESKFSYTTKTVQIDIVKLPKIRASIIPKPSKAFVRAIKAALRKSKRLERRKALELVFEKYGYTLFTQVHEENHKDEKAEGSIRGATNMVCPEAASTVQGQVQSGSAENSTTSRTKQDKAATIEVVGGKEIPIPAPDWIPTVDDPSTWRHMEVLEKIPIYKILKDERDIVQIEDSLGPLTIAKILEKPWTEADPSAKLQVTEAIKKTLMKFPVDRVDFDDGVYHCIIDNVEWQLNWYFDTTWCGPKMSVDRANDTVCLKFSEIHAVASDVAWLTNRHSKFPKYGDVGLARIHIKDLAFNITISLSTGSSCCTSVTFKSMDSKGHDSHYGSLLMPSGPWLYKILLGGLVKGITDALQDLKL